MTHGYETWCHECGWNIVAPAPRRPVRSRVDRIYAAAGRRLGERLEGELLAADELAPRLTPAKAAAYAVALGVHALTAALAGGASPSPS